MTKICKRYDNSGTMIRLVNGQSPSSGRVELFHNGEWGTICDDGFDKSDATVICTMLGYNNTYVY